MKRELNQCILLLCKFDEDRNIIVYGIENLSTNYYIGYINRCINDGKIQFSCSSLDKLYEDLMKISTSDNFEIKAYTHLNIFKYSYISGYIRMISARKSRSVNHKYKPVNYTLNPNYILGNTNFFCSKCKRIIKVYNQPFVSFAKNTANIMNTAGLFGSLNSRIICPVCEKSDYTFHVDDLYKDIIKTLNEKGYHTKFHCQGHTNNSVFYSKGIYPYISFEQFNHILSKISDIDERWFNKNFYTRFNNDGGLTVYANHKDMLSRHLTDEEYILMYKSLFSELAKKLPNNKENNI